MAPEELQLLLNEAAPSRLTTIVDVGAIPMNQPPYHILSALNACQILGFEPEANAFAALEKSKRENEKFFNEAVGDGSTRDLYLYRHESMTSIFEPFRPGLTALAWARMRTVRGRASTKTVALDSFPGPPPFDLMKIDIQGAEKLGSRPIDFRLLA